MGACLLSRPADDDEELEQQQSQVLLLGLQAVGGFLDALQQLVAQNLQDVVREERQHGGNLLWPGHTEARRTSWGWGGKIGQLPCMREVSSQYKQGQFQGPSAAFTHKCLMYFTSRKNSVTSALLI